MPPKAEAPLTEEPVLEGPITEGLEVIAEDPRWEALGLEALAHLACSATLSHLGLPAEAEIAVLGCDDARIAVLNADFRAKPQPTNVLSWPAAELAPAAEGAAPAPPAAGPFGTLELGDIALAYETCAAEAQAAGKPLADHVLHLLVHGCLHLLGHDHERPGDAARMEGLETEILAKLGLPDPYEESGHMARAER